MRSSSHRGNRSSFSRKAADVQSFSWRLCAFARIVFDMGIEETRDNIDMRQVLLHRGEDGSWVAECPRAFRDMFRQGLISK